jgi:dienelactone hydrolase
VSDRARLRALLGDMPARHVPAATLRERRDGIEDWRLQVADDAIPATLVLPERSPRGVVLYCHAHGNNFAIGRDELLHGRPALATPPYGEALPKLGYAALAIDHRGFGARAAVSERLLNKRFLWEGRTLWGMRVADTLAAYDWLRADARFASLPVVSFGLSMGGTMAYWTAALETGIAACVDLCVLAEFDALLESGADDLHAEYFFVPGLRKHFTAASINALVAPRPHLSCAGRDDPLTPPAGLAAIDGAMRAAYAAADASQAWEQRVFPCGHVETPAMRAAVEGFLNRVMPPRPATAAIRSSPRTP